MEYYDCFAASYSRARAKFLKAAVDAAGEVRSFVHPDRKTPDDEALAIGLHARFVQRAIERARVLSDRRGGRQQPRRDER